MTTSLYSFDIYVTKGGKPLDLYGDAEAHAQLFERYEGDATPGMKNGEAFIGFDLEATSIGAAIDQARAAVDLLGATMERIEFHTGEAEEERALA
jgi:hypothetical protein